MRKIIIKRNGKEQEVFLVFRLAKGAIVSETDTDEKKFFVPEENLVTQLEQRKN